MSHPHCKQQRRFNIPALESPPVLRFFRNDEKARAKKKTPRVVCMYSFIGVHTLQPTKSHNGLPEITLIYTNPKPNLLQSELPPQS